MPRRPRVLTETGWYHAMNRGVDRCDVFFDDADRRDFGMALGAAHEWTSVEVHAYCLMPNHFHLILRAVYGTDLSRFMHHLGTSYTRRLNDRQRRDGPIFRGRFHSVPITSDAQLMVALRYVHLNPVALTGVNDLDLYRWSSHRTYLGHRAAPAWLTIRTLREYFTDVDDYQRFIHADAAEPSFDAASVAQLVELAVGETDLDPRSRRALIRTVMFALIDRFPDAQAALTDELGASSPGALRMARLRARKRFATDRQLRALVARIEPLLVTPPPSRSGSDPERDGQGVVRRSPARSWAA